MTDTPTTGGTVRYHRADYDPERAYPWMVWFTENVVYNFTAAEGEAMGLTPPAPAPLVVTCNGHSIELSDEAAAAFSRVWADLNDADGWQNREACIALARLLRDARQDPQPASERNVAVLVPNPDERSREFSPWALRVPSGEIAEVLNDDEALEWGFAIDPQAASEPAPPEHWCNCPPDVCRGIGPDAGGCSWCWAKDSDEPCPNAVGDPQPASDRCQTCGSEGLTVCTNACRWPQDEPSPWQVIPNSDPQPTPADGEFSLSAELLAQVESDVYVYGNAFVQFGNGSPYRINPTRVIVKVRDPEPASDPSPHQPAPADSDTLDPAAMPIGTVLLYRFMASRDDGRMRVKTADGWLNNSGLPQAMSLNAEDYTVVHRPAPVSPAEGLRAVLAGRDDADELIDYAARYWVKYEATTSHKHVLLVHAVGDAARSGGAT